MFALAAALLVGAIPPPRALAGGFDLWDEHPDRPRIRPRFTADAGTRLGANGPEVVIGVEVAYSELYFRPVGSRFECRFDLVLVLVRDGRQVGGDSFTESRRVNRRDQTRTPGAKVERQLVIPASPGKYEVQVILREASAGLESRLEWRLVVPDYTRSPLSLSSLWITGEEAAGSDSAAAVVPAGWLLSYDYGETAVPRWVLGEVYRPDGGADSIEVSWRLFGSRQEVVQRGKSTVGGGKRTTFRLEPNFAALWMGDHELEVNARAQGFEARRRVSFRTTSTTSAMEANVEQSLDLVGLIATRQEMDELKRAPVTERDDAWERFWKRRDPTPETVENEFRTEFFRRVRYANEQFSVLGPGWRSDRGRIYIQYGPPDQVESQPFNIDSPAYEIWTYDRVNRRFVFVDYDGFGRYELYQPGR